MDDLDRRMAYPHKGDLFEWQDHAVIVTRVAKDGTWADVRVRHPFGNGGKVYCQLHKDHQTGSARHDHFARHAGSDVMW